MLKKLNSFIYTSLIISVLFILVGVGMLLFPEISLNIIAYSVAIIFILLGIALYIRTDKYTIFIDTTLISILLIILGGIILLYPESFSLIIPLSLGIWIITDSIFKIRIALSLKDDKDIPWILLLILSMLSLICGVIFIIHPIASSKIITSTFGIIVICYAICDIVDMVMFKKYINDIVKTLKKHLTFIEK